jgi:putative addiction module killer protein
LRVGEYVRPDGTSPYGAWFDDLPVQAARRIATARSRLEQGNTSAVKWIGVIGEYRIDWGPGYRIYLGQAGTHEIILLCGGTKQRQRTDIELAETLWLEYKRRKVMARKVKRG